ncbi:MAG: hypothetical protein WC346_01305 [Methanogenium sp.]|jgi:hypothetical protein
MYNEEEIYDVNDLKRLFSEKQISALKKALNPLKNHLETDDVRKLERLIETNPLRRALKDGVKICESAFFLAFGTRNAVQSVALERESERKKNDLLGRLYSYPLDK